MIGLFHSARDGMSMHAPLHTTSSIYLDPPSDQYPWVMYIDMDIPPPCMLLQVAVKVGHNCN